MTKTHSDRLAQMYMNQAINQDLQPVMTFEKDGLCVVKAPVEAKFFHGGGILHGSISFRLLDDACTFAAWSMVTDKACVTKSLNIFFQAPINQGEMEARAELIEMSKDVNEIYVKGTLLNNGMVAASCDAVIARMSSSKIKSPVS